MDWKSVQAVEQTKANEASSQGWSVFNFALGAAAAVGIWYVYLRKRP